MTCDEIKKTLPAYMDGELPSGDMDRTSRHLSTCTDCSREFAELKTMAGLLKDLPDIEPPPFFEQRIMSRIREDAESKTGILQKFFYPLHIKIPIQAVATVLVAVLAFYVYRGGDPEIKQIAPLPVPMTERRQTETASPRNNITTAKKIPAPEIHEKDAGLKHTPSFTAPPPAQTALAPVKDEPVASPAPASREAPSPSSAGSTVPKVVQEKMMKESDDQVINQRQAMSPHLDLGKTLDAKALKAENKEKDAETVSSMKKAGSIAAAPTVSSTRSGTSQTASLSDMTLHVRDLPQAYQDIEKCVHDFDGRIVERRHVSGKDIVKIEMDALHVPDLLHRLQDIGQAIRHQKRSVLSQGKTIVFIEIVQVP